MAIPSGAGTEVLRHSAINANNATSSRLDWGGTTGTGTLRTSGNSAGVINVPANVIITVLNIICYSSASQTVESYIDWAGSGTSVYLFAESVSAGQTYVFSDKVVLREGDELVVENSGNNADWQANFIYQDWT